MLDGLKQVLGHALSFCHLPQPTAIGGRGRRNVFSPAYQSRRPFLRTRRYLNNVVSPSVLV